MFELFLDIKRIIGREFDDGVVQRFAQSMQTQFVVRKLEGKPVFEFEQGGQVRCFFLSLISFVFLVTHSVSTGHFSSYFG